MMCKPLILAVLVACSIAVSASPVGYFSALTRHEVDNAYADSRVANDVTVFSSQLARRSVVDDVAAGLSRRSAMPGGGGLDWGEYQGNCARDVEDVVSRAVDHVPRSPLTQRKVVDRIITGISERSPQEELNWGAGCNRAEHILRRDIDNVVSSAAQDLRLMWPNSNDNDLALLDYMKKQVTYGILSVMERGVADIDDVSSHR